MEGTGGRERGAFHVPSAIEELLPPPPSSLPPLWWCSRKGGYMESSKEELIRKKGDFFINLDLIICCKRANSITLSLFKLSKYHY